MHAANMRRSLAQNLQMNNLYLWFQRYPDALRASERPSQRFRVLLDGKLKARWLAQPSSFARVGVLKEQF